MAMLAAGGTAAAEGRASVAIAEFSYKDTSGEVRDQTADHRVWLDMLRRLMREDVEGSGKFILADLQCAASECAVEDGAASEALVAAARKAGARYLVVVGVQKMSTLIQWARLLVLDVKDNKVILDRLVTFRGDNEEAWRHAALFLAHHVNGIAVQ